MTHSEAVDYLADNLKRTKVDTRRMLAQTTQTIKQLLDQERIIVLPGLGTFRTKERNRRKGYHPLKKQFMMLPPKRVVTFKAGQSLRNHVKNKKVEK